jgi:hypothetical protein
MSRILPKLERGPRYHERMSSGKKGRQGGIVSVLLSGAAALLAGFVALSATADAPLAAAALLIDVAPVPLDPGDPSRSSVGPLQYMGGLWLRADDPRFGGLSDLRVSADGERLVAVSDCGNGLTARLTYDEGGRLTGLTGAQLVALTDSRGGALAADEIDAESLVATPEGDLEVGFEGRGRIQAYGPGLAGPARPLVAPAALAECGRNGGLELMSDIGGGRRLLVCETRRGASTSVPAWIGRDETWQERVYPLRFDGGWAGEPFRPTAGARLPNGDLLILERRFPPLAARLVRLERGSLEGGGSLEPRELVRLEPPLTLDNFEGVEVRQDARGRTLVYVLSDDNNCGKAGSAPRRGLQRTLLLLFVLLG